jgi:hypothetical protein
MGNGDEKVVNHQNLLVGALQLTGKIIINCFQISLVKIVLKQIWLQLNTFSKC